MMWSTLPAFLFVVCLTPPLEVLAAAKILAPPGSANVTGTRAKRQASCHDKYQKVVTGHTACLPGRKQPAVNEAEKQLILDKHNEYRSNANPTAANMMKLEWDDELAMIAQKWADNCDFNHEEGSKRFIPGHWRVGQNLAHGNDDWEHMIYLWHIEVKDFIYGVGAIGDKKILHYTAMMWATTTHIGCGVQTCNDKKLYACNYAPSGNQASSVNKPYKAGYPCADCPGHCNKEDRLCDCKGLKCYNDATLNPSTCTCECKDVNGLYFGRHCDLSCMGSDADFCSEESYKCPQYATYCPHKCQVCPYGGVDYQCKDNHDSCRYWGSIGECVKNPSYMLPNCNKTCGECGAGCQDSQQSCPSWAMSPQDFCDDDRYRDYMIADCKKSCGQCNMNNPCPDIESPQDCDYWKNLGYCSGQYFEFMNAKCKKTCELCT